MCGGRSVLTEKQVGPDVQDVSGLDCQGNRLSGADEAWVPVPDCVLGQGARRVRSALGLNEMK